MVDTEHTRRSDAELQISAAEQVFRDYLVPEVSKNDPRMISVGCQFGYEASPFMELFPNGQYFGIDIVPGIIKAANRIHQADSGISFDVRDARNMDAFGEAKWDIVFLGHPQTQGSFFTHLGDGSREDWERIIKNSASAISEKGLVIATSHTPQEADLVANYLKDSGLKVVQTINKRPVSGALHADIVIGKNEI